MSVASKHAGDAVPCDYISSLVLLLLNLRYRFPFPLCSIIPLWFYRIIVTYCFALSSIIITYIFNACTPLRVIFIDNALLKFMRYRYLFRKSLSLHYYANVWKNSIHWCTNNFARPSREEWTNSNTKNAGSRWLLS